MRGSYDPAKTWRLADDADCLAWFIAAIGLSQPRVLGLSFGGGALRLQLFGRHPEVSLTLLLAGAYARWGGSLPPEEVEGDWPDLPAARSGHPRTGSRRTSQEALNVGEVAATSKQM